MADHDCVIGYLNDSYHGGLATVKRLKYHIERNVQYNKSLHEDTRFRYETWMYRPVYTFARYGDRRYSTDLTRFDYCPYCGKKIDWKGIKSIDYQGT